ncbi:MAG TPA: hypothetical protein DCE71_04680 [Parachlamydiales bacterium]|nr:hypothetical protein [Parachlamydiales bacterium]
MDEFKSFAEENQENSRLKLEMARRFLNKLSNGDQNAVFTFQFFGEGPNSESVYPHIIHGTYEERRDYLIKQNTIGSGVFVTVNPTDGKGWKA